MADKSDTSEEATRLKKGRYGHLAQRNVDRVKQWGGRWVLPPRCYWAGQGSWRIKTVMQTLIDGMIDHRQRPDLDAAQASSCLLKSSLPPERLASVQSHLLGLSTPGRLLRA